METTEVRDVPSEASKGVSIDVQSMTDYRRKFESYRQKNRHATESEILDLMKEYIKRRIDGLVECECQTGITDVTTVTLSVMSSTVIPLSGVAVAVAATVMHCLSFSVTLGLIPLLNDSDMNSMSSQIQDSIKLESDKRRLMEGVETAVPEILNTSGLSDDCVNLWVEILKDTLAEVICNSAMDATWILTPLLAVPKYFQHRNHLKSMYRKLGDKAQVVHYTWTEQNCVRYKGRSRTA